MTKERNRKTHNAGVAQEVQQPASIVQSPAGIIGGQLPRWLVTVLLLGVPSLAFLRILGHEFVNYDDFVNLYNNRFIIVLNGFYQLLFWLSPFEGLYIPLTYTIWSGLSALSKLLPSADWNGLNPAIFHAANLAVHLGSTLLVHRLLRRLFQDEHGWGSLTGALLFAVHPVQVEPVAWATGMKDLLAGFFSIACLDRYAAMAETTGKARARLYLQAVALLACALLAKPSSMVVPVLAAIIALVLQGRDWREVGKELLPWLALVIPVMGITRFVQGGTVLKYVPHWWERLLVAGDSFSFYVAKLFFPDHLTFDYGRTPQAILGHTWVYATGGAPYLAAAFLFWKGRRPWLLAAICIFATVLLPVSGLVNFTHQKVSTVADRYLYLAMLGPAMICAWFVSRRAGRVVLVAAGIILFSLAVRSAIQAGTWKDTVALTRHAMKINPNSWLSHNNLGEVLRQKGELEEAARHVREAMRIDPEFNLAHYNLGVLMEDMGRPLEAIPHYLRAIELKPDTPGAHYSLGLIYAQQGRFAEAERHLRIAVSLKPYEADPHINLGVALVGQGRHAEAEAPFREALRLEPDSAGAHNGLGAVLLEKGRLPEAITHFQEALRFFPGMVEAQNNLLQAIARQRSGGG